jgi:transcriptional regulator with XRE-family HTH domain
MLLRQVLFSAMRGSVISGDLLREARLRAGLSQAELGRRVRRPQSVIGRWERGQVLPSLETLRKLVRACGLELCFRLARHDDSYAAHIERMLDLTPAERVEHAVARARTYRRLRAQLDRARDG